MDKEDFPTLQPIVMSTTVLQLIKPQKLLLTNNCWIYSVHKQEFSGQGFVGFWVCFLNILLNALKKKKRWYLHAISGASEHELDICHCIIKYKRKSYNNLFYKFRIFESKSSMTRTVACLYSFYIYTYIYVYVFLADKVLKI